MLPIQLKIFLAFIFCLPLAAATWNTDGSASDAQAKIDSASSGDTVLWPSGGSFSWTTGVSVPNTKGITLDGNGSTINRSSGTSTLFTISANATVGSRITGFTITQTGSGFQISAAGTWGSTAAFRIDNCTLVTSGSGTIIRLTRGPGLIDNNYIRANGASETIHNWGGSPDNPPGTCANGWTDVITPGSSEAIYCEDNLFERYTLTDPFFTGCSAMHNFYGSRIVFRHNTLKGMHFDVHGNTHPCGRWWEVYDNHFIEPEVMNQSNAIALRGGSGVCFNNTREKEGGGGFQGAMGIQLREESTPGTCPLIYQIGRGRVTAGDGCPDNGGEHEDDPAYFWNNFADPGVEGGDPGAACVVLNDSYFLSEKPSYTPYTYPHPLRGEEGGGGGEASGSGKGRGQQGTAGRFRMR